MPSYLLQENNDFLLQENGDKIILDTLYLISGTASLAGLLVENALITLIDSTTDQVVATALTNVSGYYEFTGLDSAKEYHVTAEYEDSPDQYNAKSLPFVVPVR